MANSICNYCEHGFRNPSLCDGCPCKYCEDKEQGVRCMVCPNYEGQYVGGCGN